MVKSPLISRSSAFGTRRSRILTWESLGLFALWCSSIAWASLAHPHESPPDHQREWKALAVSPMANGGVTGMQLAPNNNVQSVGFVARRSSATVSPPPSPAPETQSRIRGHVGDGLYWSLRAAGASPQVAAAYLAALATEIDVGDVQPQDGFDIVLSPAKEILYAGLDRVGQRALQLVRLSENGRIEWIDAADSARPKQVDDGFSMPAQGPITSYFGYRYHPILHFTRFHAGVDIGAGWGTPIVAAGDGRVVGAGWGGGYGREVQIAHGGGLISIYGHMSQIVAQPGAFVRRGELIGYVGSSGLSTGPHLHFEVRQGGTPVNPLAVHFGGVGMVDTHLADSARSRLKALLRVGSSRI